MPNTDQDQARDRVAYGDTRVSFTARAFGRDGRVLDGGNAYADAWDTADGLRELADRWMTTGYTGRDVAYVEIVGREQVFKGYAWADNRNPDHNFFERIERDTPLPLTKADERFDCYDTTVMDYFERVHERRSDGSCRCGKYAPKFGPGRV